MKMKVVVVVGVKKGRSVVRKEGMMLILSCQAGLGKGKRKQCDSRAECVSVNVHLC